MGARIDFTAILKMQYTKASKVTYILLDHFVLDTLLDGMSEDMFNRDKVPQIGARRSTINAYARQINFQVPEY